MFDEIWYNTLILPPFTPPNWVFMPVWAVLYTMIAVAFMVFLANAPRPPNRRAMTYFIVQMMCNVAWTPVFFGLHNIFAALLILITMDIFVALTIKEFYRVSKLAAGLLVPYFLWGLYALYLNAAIKAGPIAGMTG